MLGGAADALCHSHTLRYAREPAPLSTFGRPAGEESTAMNRRITVRVRTQLACAIGCGVLLLAGFAPAATAAAPAARDPFLDGLAGRWLFTGTVHGQHVDYIGRGRWVLGDGWLRLKLLDAGTPPAYEADVYLGYDAAAGDYIAHWLDRFGAAGARVVASGHREGRRLTLEFPYESSTFRDTLTLAADGASGTLLEAQYNLMI